MRGLPVLNFVTCTTYWPTSIITKSPSAVLPGHAIGSNINRHFHDNLLSISFRFFNLFPRWYKVGVYNRAYLHYSVFIQCYNLNLLTVCGASSNVMSIICPPVWDSNPDLLKTGVTIPWHLCHPQLRQSCHNHEVWESQTVWVCPNHNALMSRLAKYREV